MATRGRPSTKDAAKALGPDRVPENQKREVYERVRRAVDAKGGGCTNHLVGSSPWDKQEQKVLEDGLRYYPHERHSNMLIYIRIAASLPKKTVRDVAHHLRHMQDVHRAKLDAAGMNSAKRHHPDPAAAAAMAAMHEHQMAAMFAANAAGGIAAMHTLPGLAQGLAGPGGPGPHLKDEKVEARVCALLQENMAVITSIRENMVMGRFLDNHSLMLTFDKNVKEVTALLATLPFAEMQKLPVQINPYFITGSLPPGMAPGMAQQPLQQVSPIHHHHAPPVSSASNTASQLPGCGVGTSHGNGNGVTTAGAPVGSVALSSSMASAAAPPGVAVGVQQPLPPPPPLQQQQQQQQQIFAAAPPLITPAAQALQSTQVVVEASAVVAAAKAAASAAAAVIAASQMGAQTSAEAQPASCCPPAATTAPIAAPAVATPAGVEPPAVEVPVAVESRQGVSRGGNGGGWEKGPPPAEGGVVPAPSGA